eukprot:350988-Chlamydomonas_euryale.AAC.2
MLVRLRVTGSCLYTWSPPNGKLCVKFTSVPSDSTFGCAVTRVPGTSSFKNAGCGRGEGWEPGQGCVDTHVLCLLSVHAAGGRCTDVFWIDTVLPRSTTARPQASLRAQSPRRSWMLA